MVRFRVRLAAFRERVVCTVVALGLVVIVAPGLSACRGLPLAHTSGPEKPRPTADTHGLAGVVRVEGIRRRSIFRTTVHRGQGAIIAPNVVATARHVLDGPLDGAQVKSQNNEKMPVLGILADDEPNDLLLLAVGTGQGSLPFSLAERAPTRGDPVKILHMAGADARVVEISGHVLSGAYPIDQMGGRTVRVRAEVSPGTSGAPVIDRDGKLLGLVINVFPSRPGVCGVAPAARIRELLSRAGAIIPLKTWTRDALVEPAARGRVMYQEALSAQGARNFSLALDRFEQALALSLPAHLTEACWGRIVDCLEQLNRTEEGVARTRTLLAAAPESTWRRRVHALALLRAGQVARAIRHFQAVAKQLPSNPGAQHDLAGALGWGGRWAESLHAARKAVALAPRDAYYHYAVAVVLDNLGQSAQAVTEYRHALRIDPDLPYAHTCLGHELLTMGLVSAAAASFQEACASDPTDAAAARGLGEALCRLGEFDRARNALRRAVTLGPPPSGPVILMEVDKANAYYWLWWACAALGDEACANEARRRLAQLERSESPQVR